MPKNKLKTQIQQFEIMRLKHKENPYINNAVNSFKNQ